MNSIGSDGRESMSDELHKLEERIAWLERRMAWLLLFAICAVSFPILYIVDQALIKNEVELLIRSIVIGLCVSICLAVGSFLLFKSMPDQSNVKDIVGEWPP